MKKHSLWLPLALFSSLMLLPVLGEEQQEQKNDEKTYIADEISVVTTRRAMALEDVPTSLSLVSEEEVFRSGTTVGDVLKDVPGVQVSSTGSGFKQISVRGESNSRVLILVDGQRITENKGMNGAPLLISTSDIEHIEVLKGGGSVLHGSEAVAGVVNIITKKPSDENVSLELGTRYDGVSNGYESSAAVSGTIDSFNYRLGYSKLEQNEYDTGDGQLDHTGYENENITLSLGWEKENYSIGLKIDHFEGSSEVNTSGVPGEKNTMLMKLPRWDRDKVAVFYEWRDLNEYFVKLRVDGYYQKTDKHFLQEMPMGRVGTVWSNRVNEERTLGLSVQADFSLGNHYVIVGGDYYYSVLDSHERGGDPAFIPMVGATIQEFDQSYDALSEHVSLFIQDEWTFAENWSAIYGFRGTYFRNELKDAKNRLTGETVDDREEGSTDDFFGAFSFGLMNKSFEDWVIRANVSQGFRSPNLNELYVGSSMMGQINYPNKDLDVETSITYDFGVRYYKNSWTFDWSVFYSESEDYITTETTTATSSLGAGEVWYVNIDKAKAWGTEVSLSYDYAINDNFSLTPYTDLTYLRRKYTTEETSTYNSGNPTLFGRTGLRSAWREKNKAIWGNLNVRYSTDSKDQDGSEDAGWATCNFSCGIDWYANSEVQYFRKISLSAGIDNIFDVAYYLPQSSLMQPGRNIWIAIKAIF